MSGKEVRYTPNMLDIMTQKEAKKCLLIYTKMDMSIMELHIT